MCIVQPKTQNTNHLPPPISQGIPASIRSISPQSSSELDTNHHDIIDETIKHVTQTLNQTFMTSNPCNTNTNKDLINTPHDNISNLQPTQDVNLHTTPNITKTKSKTH